MIYHSAVQVNSIFNQRVACGIPQTISRRIGLVNAIYHTKWLPSAQRHVLMPPAYNYCDRVQRPTACWATEFDGEPNGPSPYPQGPKSDVWHLLKSVCQLWAVVLPVGYGAVPLVAELLKDPPLAAASCEVVVLALVWNILQDKGFQPNVVFSNPKCMGIGALLATAALVINQSLFASADNLGTEGLSTMVAGLSGIQKAELLTSSAILAPATEELIYRGFILSSLLNLRVSPVVAVLTTSAAFAVAHLQPTALPELFVVGLALGSATVINRGNLAASFTGHALYNGALFLNLLLATP